MPIWLPRSINTVHCSDHVREIGGRHVGRVGAMQCVSSAPWTITVRWLDTGWLSDLDIDTIEFAERE